MDDPRQIARADRILEEFLTLPGSQQVRVADAINKIHKSGWADYNAQEAHHYAWLWEAIIEGGKTAEPPVHFPPLLVAATTGCARTKETGENSLGERWLDLLWTMVDFIDRSCPPNTSEDIRKKIAAEIIRSIVWDIRRVHRFQKTIFAAQVLNNFTRLDAVMNNAFCGLAEGKMLHWIA